MLDAKWLFGNCHFCDEPDRTHERYCPALFYLVIIEFDESEKHKYLSSQTKKKFEPEWILISRPLLKYNRYSIKKQIGIYNIHYLKWLIVKIQIKTWEII